MLIVQMEISRLIKQHYRILKAYRIFKAINQDGQKSSPKKNPMYYSEQFLISLEQLLSSTYKTQCILRRAASVKRLALAMYREGCFQTTRLYHCWLYQKRWFKIHPFFVFETELLSFQCHRRRYHHCHLLRN